MISMCNIPKNPQRNPLPSVPEDSSSYENDESDNRNRPNACFKFGKSSWLSGYTDAQTTGRGFIYPGNTAPGFFV